MEKDNSNIYQFIFTNLVGKNLCTDELVYQLDEGKLEGTYSDEMFFSDFQECESTFSFNMTTITKEKVYILDRDRNRDEIQKDFTGVSVFHYEVSERKSTSELTGFMRLLSSTVQNHTMESVVYGVSGFKLGNNELKWNENQLLYRDMPSQEGKFKSVAFDANIRIFFEQNKVRFEYIPHYYDVNTITFEKTFSKDSYPIFLTKEK